MNLSLFAQNLHGPWMIHPEQAAVMMPLVRGIIAGNHLDLSGVEKPAISSKVSCQSYYIGEAVNNPHSDKSVYITYLNGTMTKYETCYNWGTRDIAQELLKADKDPDIIGHIIVAESGGGQADSVPELADAIQQLKKPIVSFVDGMAASACIYAISYTQKIIANQPTARIGCIGTMMTVSGWPKMRKDSDGYVEVRIYADQSSEKNADYEAALEGNTQIIRDETLNPLCERFINDMKANRPNVTDDLLKGKTYFAENVVGTLIDSIGTFDDAMTAVIELAEANNATNTSESMARYARLESIPGLEEQVYAEDGSTVLQECQLEAIEQALTTPRAEENDLQAQMDSLTQAHAAELASLREDISSRDETISTQASRISELEAALDAAVAREELEDPATVVVEGDPSNSEDAGYTPAKNFSEAEAACKEFLNRK